MLQSARLAVTYWGLVRDFLFGHTPRGPLAVLKDQFLSESPVKDVCSHVTNFRSCLHRALELARENLGRAQGKMKNWYDRKAVSRHFEVGEKVLMLLPIPGSALQARFSGPYVVEDKVSDRDYVIATPDRRQQRRLCHVNMLKPYFERVPIPACSPRSIQSSILGSGLQSGLVTALTRR